MDTSYLAVAGLPGAADPSAKRDIVPIARITATKGVARTGYAPRLSCVWPGLLAAVLAVATGVIPVTLTSERQAAASSGLATLLYVNENPYGPNQVAAYSVTPTGGLHQVGVYSTGHPGASASFATAERADLARTTGHLYALNVGDLNGPLRPIYSTYICPRPMAPLWLLHFEPSPSSPPSWSVYWPYGLAMER